MRMEDHLRRNAERWPEKTALVTGEAQLGYRELDAYSDRLAEAMVRRGVVPGDRILMIAESRAETVVAFFAAWKAGAVPCPLHPSIKQDKLRSIIDSVRPAFIAAPARFIPTVEAALSDAAIVPGKIFVGEAAELAVLGWESFDHLIRSPAAGLLPSLADDAALGLLIHTSGSTGTPKGVMLSHANLQAACSSIAGYLGNTADDVVLSVLPLSFGYGISQMLTMAMVGGTLALERSFAFPRKIVERLSDVGATGLPLVPTMAALLAGIQDLGPGSLPHLRYVTAAAAAMPPALTQRMRELLPHAELFLMYGQTECIRATYLAPEEIERRPLSVGKAIPGTRAFVVDETGAVATSGTIGELVVEGPHVMMGYWQDQPATTEKLTVLPEGGRLHTGDLFRADDDGYLYFVSRRDDIIKTKGEKVSPQEVERVLYALPGIREAAVAGVPDAIFGEVIRAYVALEPGSRLTEREVLRHCSLNLEDYMVPKSVEFRHALPRTSTGKIRLSAETTPTEFEGTA